jgi:hypothetical protein
LFLSWGFVIPTPSSTAFRNHKRTGCACSTNWVSWGSYGSHTGPRRDTVVLCELKDMPTRGEAGLSMRDQRPQSLSFACAAMATRCRGSLQRTSIIRRARMRDAGNKSSVGRVGSSQCCGVDDLAPSAGTSARPTCPALQQR